MGRSRVAARRPGVVAGVALLVAALAPAASGVSIQATSTTVQQQGDKGQICVFLSTGGLQVAGTQNDLQWDGSCATLIDVGGSKGDCAVAGSHGKGLQQTLNPLGRDFAFRALVLSLSNVDPMPDGPLYCCNFEGEAEPGQCCSIAVTNTGATDPRGGALSASGNTAKICTAQGSNQPGRPIGSVNNGQPLTTGNTGTGGDAGGGAAAPPPVPPPAAPAGGGPAPVQVLQGGGARMENPEGAGVAPLPAVTVQVPTPAAAQPPAAQPAASAPQPALPPPTQAMTSVPTAAPTAPAPEDTPTKKVAAAPTAAPSRASAPPKQEPAKPAAQAEKGGGWFGCQIAAGASVGPVVGLGLLAAVGAAVRRRSAARRRLDSRTQRERGGYVDDK
jgi:hypothetical protein